MNRWEVWGLNGWVLRMKRMGFLGVETAGWGVDNEFLGVENGWLGLKMNGWEFGGEMAGC